MHKTPSKIAMFLPTTFFSLTQTTPILSLFYRYNYYSIYIIFSSSQIHPPLVNLYIIMMHYYYDAFIDKLKIIMASHFIIRYCPLSFSFHPPTFVVEKEKKGRCLSLKKVINRNLITTK
jgi:hypothetical protein